MTRSMIAVLCAAALLSCSDATGPTVDPPPPPPKPTLSLSASSAAIMQHEDITLTWEAQHANGCSASGTWSGSKATSGSETITLDVSGSHTFTLACNGAGGEVSRSVTVTVEKLPEPEPNKLTVRATVTPDSGYIPLTVDVFIVVDSAQEGDIRYGIDCTSNGTLEVEDTVSATSYSKQAACTYDIAGSRKVTVHAWQGDAHGQDTARVHLYEKQMPLFIYYYALPDTVRGNETSLLQWKTELAGTCTASGAWSGEKPTAGSQLVQPINDGTEFVLTCSGVADASLTVSDTVTIAMLPAPYMLWAKAAQTYGYGELRGVDLAAFSGLEPGTPVRYRFDCESDGVWELDVESAAGEYIAWGLCDYLTVGEHVVRITIDAPDLSHTFQRSVSVMPARSSQERFTADRPDDEVNPDQLHAIYMVAADGTDRRLDEFGIIGHSVDAAQRWMREQTGGGELIFDMHNGVLDVSFIRMPQSKQELYGYDQRLLLGATREALKSAGFSEKNYVIFFDALTSIRQVCGLAPPRQAHIFLGECPGRLADAPSAHATALDLTVTHEILHLAGLVDIKAPHHVGADHVNDHHDDLMSAYYNYDASRVILDFGRDDYFGENVPAGVRRLEDAPFFRNP